MRVGVVNGALVGMLVGGRLVGRAELLMAPFLSHGLVLSTTTPASGYGFFLSPLLPFFLLLFFSSDAAPEVFWYFVLADEFPLPFLLDFLAPCATDSFLRSSSEDWSVLAPVDPANG